jgi:non-canonical purine NTP pyrophosphatase (RdgB/HAM1 family)
MLYFITGNKKKFAEIQSVFPDIQQLEIDLPEIQELDPQRIIEEKLKEALKHHEGEFIVEDTSLCMDAMNGLPGPFIKWFLQTIGCSGLFEIAKRFENAKAQARTLIGYAKSGEDIHFFEGVLPGMIVEPLDASGFGWDPIFQPEGSTTTFAGMGVEEKNKISMRKLAATKLKAYLDGKTV